MSPSAPSVAALSPPPPECPVAVVVIPVFNDWDAATLLLRDLAAVLPTLQYRLHPLFVDDGSTEEPDEPFLQAARAFGAPVRLLSLRLNLGHQRAIGVGLCHVWDHVPCSAIVVMDGDGEDAPRDLASLLQAHDDAGGMAVVFAERRRRSESLAFRIGYHAYRLLHRLLTGVSVRFGNYSVMPRRSLDNLVVNPDLWNHYAASVVASRIRYRAVPTSRAQRYAGQSRMNLVSLVAHGLSAISVFGDRAVTRVLLATFAAMTLAVAGLVAVVGLKLGTPNTAQGWATTAFGALAAVTLQLAVLAAISVLSLLRGRAGAFVVPLRDYPLFVRGSTLLSSEGA